MTGHRRSSDRATSGAAGHDGPVRVVSAGSATRLAPARRPASRRRRVAAIGASVACLSGLAGGYLAAPAFAQSAAATIAHQQALVPGTACTVAAKACVDLETQKAWLFKDGKVMRGPVKISSGGPGEETPTGHSLRVYRKEAMHLSEESRMPNGQPAKMPWSVFFEDGGIAFHGGDPARDSAGCIHLDEPDAKAWFDYLQVGDQVQVVKGSEELAARNGGGHDADYDAHDSEDEDSQ
jgi:hypothetical protein